MDGFQFIIESPHQSRGHRKRPRLVTSCDNCRIKKIKCLQQTPETKCDACKASKVPCRFRDRERYFEERSRAIAGSSTGPLVDNSRSSSEASERRNATPPLRARMSSYPYPVVDHYLLNSPPMMGYQGQARSASHSPPSAFVIPSSENPVRYPSYPPDPFSGADTYHRRSYRPPLSLPDKLLTAKRIRPGLPSINASRNDAIDFNSTSSENSLFLDQMNLPLPLSRHSGTDNSLLFDPDHHGQPNAMLMPHFILLFFEHIGHECQFLYYEETLEKFFHQTLSTLLSSCIAALAARYSDSPDLTRVGLHVVAETYENNAKDLLSSTPGLPSIDTLHALVLLALIHFRNRHPAGFRAYCQMAMKMALDLGISDERAVQTNPDQRERSMLKSTWQSVYQLYNTAFNGA